MPKIGKTGYSVAQAISELIDNSVDARMVGKLLTVQVTLGGKNKDVIEVSDNGCGMDEKTAEKSLTLGCSSKEGQLGEFGMGLKTAATSLGKKFRVTTTRKGVDQEYVLDFDEDQWIEKGDWTSHEMKIKSGASKRRSGTCVRIERLNCNVYPSLPSILRKDFATRFAPYIENGEVEIKVNKKLCKPEPLDLNEEYCSPDGKEAFEVTLESGNTVHGWRGLLKKGSVRGEYGFRVFRRGRLITCSAKIGFSPHSESRQIVGEIHLDHVPVTHNKREFIQESSLYREIVKEGGIFWNDMRNIVNQARSSVRKSDISQGVMDGVSDQVDDMLKAMRQMPELQEYTIPSAKEKKRAGEGDEKEGLADFEIEKRNKGEEDEVGNDVKEDGDMTDSGGSRRDAKKKKQTKSTHYVTINGKNFRIEHRFSDLRDEDSLKMCEINEETGVLEVTTNTSFPGFIQSKDDIFYAVWNIAESIAQTMVEKTNRSPSEIVVIRDKILKRGSQITHERDEIEKEKKDADRLRKEYEEKMKKIKKIEEEHNIVA